MGTINYSNDFKRDAVHQITVHGYPVREVSRRLGVSKNFFYKWLKQFREPSPKFGVDHEAENRRLKREFARVTEEREIQKRQRRISRASPNEVRLHPLPGRALCNNVPRGHEQVQRSVGAAIRDLDGRVLLPAAQRGEIRHGPVQPRQFQQARHHPGGLAKRQLEQDLDPLSGHCCTMPCRALDQQSPPLPQRRIVAGPVRRAVAGGRWLAHAARLTAWINEMNHQTSEFCNNAPSMAGSGAVSQRLV